MSEAALTRHDGHAFKALTFALVAGVALMLLPYVSGLIGAGVLYAVALPVVRRLDPSRRSMWAPLLVVSALFFVIVLPGAWLLAELLAQVPDASRSIQESAAVQRLMALRIGDIRLDRHLSDASAQIIAWSSRQTVTALAGVVSGTLNLFIALFGAYYLLRGAEELWERTRAGLPFEPSTSELLRVRFHKTTEAMLLGVVLTGFAQGMLVGIAFALIGLPHPLLWGAVTAAASILPMFGSSLVWVPAVLVLVAQQRFGAAAVLGALGLIVVSNIDNALRLIVYRRVSRIHPMVTLVGAFAGVHTFGLAGLLLGPLVLSYMIELFNIYRAPHVPHLEAAA